MQLYIFAEAISTIGLIIRIDFLSVVDIMIFMYSRKKILLISVSLFFLFISFSILVAKEYLTRIDFDSMVRIQDLLSDRFIGPFSTFSDLGQFEVTFIILVILILIYRKLWLYICFFMFALFHVIELYFKSRIDQLPPPEFLIKTIKVIEFPRYHVSTEYAYPSGHAGRTMFLSIIIFFLIINSKRLNRFQKHILIAILIIFNFFMYISRIFLGEHWASDVLGGILLASSLVFFSLIFYRRPVGRPKTK